MSQGYQGLLDPDMELYQEAWEDVEQWGCDYLERAIYYGYRLGSYYST
jgi:hypothetical protein